MWWNVIKCMVSYIVSMQRIRATAGLEFKLNICSNMSPSVSHLQYLTICTYLAHIWADIWLKVFSSQFVPTMMISVRNMARLYSGWRVFAAARHVHFLRVCGRNCNDFCTAVFLEPTFHPHLPRGQILFLVVVYCFKKTGFIYFVKIGLDFCIAESDRIFGGIYTFLKIFWGIICTFLRGYICMYLFGGICTFLKMCIRRGVCIYMYFFWKNARPP